MYTLHLYLSDEGYHNFQEPLLTIQDICPPVHKSTAAGPFARTYWGELDGERVSIMVIPGTSAVYLQEFLRDTAFLKEQDSPNIVKIRGAVVTPMALLIVNECMAKGDLHSIIQENAYDQRSENPWVKSYKAWKAHPICRSPSNNLVLLYRNIPVLASEFGTDS